MVSIVEYTKSIPYKLRTDKGKGGAASVSVLQYRKITRLKTVSPLQRKYLFMDNTNKWVQPNVQEHSQPGLLLKESLEIPLFFFPQFTLNISSLSDICSAYDENEGDFGEKEHVLLTLNRDFPLGYFCIVM